MVRLERLLLTSIKCCLGEARIPRGTSIKNGPRSPANLLTRARWQPRSGMRPREWQLSGEALTSSSGNLKANFSGPRVPVATCPTQPPWRLIDEKSYRLHLAPRLLQPRWMLPAAALQPAGQGE